MMTISKSDYILYLKHPAWLWLKKRDQTRLPTIDDNTRAIFETGYLFETFAEQLFPTGVRLGFEDLDGYKTLPARTLKALESGVGTIFQGRFVHGQFTFICDIIQVVEGKTVDLYEIKSSTKAKLEHDYDLAFQMVVLENCGYEVRNISVIHVNSGFVKQGVIAAADICAVTDVTEAVKAKRDETTMHMSNAFNTANDETMPDISPRHAKLGCLKEWLKIYKNLQSLEAESIYDMCSVTPRHIGELEDLGVLRMRDIPEDFALNTKQQRQVDAVKAEGCIVEATAIQAYLGTLKYPLYFLDYETMASLVPYFDGMKPYQQVPFQYSLHILDTPGAELRHLEYLHADNSHPGEPLCKALQSHIGTSGSVITWNKSFEMSCNTRLGNMFPEYQEFFKALNARVVDLMDPFSQGYYVDKDFCGSASIKNVLPVLVPELSYKTLDIQEGGSAQRLWMEAVLDGKRPTERQKILGDLLEYCGLDTLAMVEIYHKLCTSPSA